LTSAEQKKTYCVYLFKKLTDKRKEKKLIDK